MSLVWTLVRKPASEEVCLRVHNVYYETHEIIVNIHRGILKLSHIIIIIVIAVPYVFHWYSGLWIQRVWSSH